MKHDFTPRVPAWAEDFPNGNVHCFYNIVDKRWEQQAYPHDVCTGWRSHPQSRGMSPWLRFIRAFGDQLTDLTNPFVGFGDEDSLTMLIIESDGHLTSDGRRAFCESYYTRGTPQHGWWVTMRVFLANESGWARIECYDEQYIDACTMARTAVYQGYIDEGENIEVHA